MNESILDPCPTIACRQADGEDHPAPEPGVDELMRDELMRDELMRDELMSIDS